MSAHADSPPHGGDHDDLLVPRGEEEEGRRVVDVGLQGGSQLGRLHSDRRYDTNINDSDEQGVLKREGEWDREWDRACGGQRNLKFDS